MRHTTLLASTSLVLLAVSAAACSARDAVASSDEMAVVSSPGCSIARGAFIARSTTNGAGEIEVSCPGAQRVSFNGEGVTDAAAFAIKPKEGINVLHVEKDEGAEVKVTDIPFLFGTFNDARAVVPGAVAVRIGAAGLSSNGHVTLPLPAGPTALNLSQVGTQLLRDQGNLLARLDGTRKDFGGFGFNGHVKIVRSSYDSRNVTIVVTPRAKGVHVEADVRAVNSVVSWQASVIGLDLLSDQIDASIGRLHVGADVDLAYEASTKSVRAQLGAHDVKVEGVDLDSAALSRVPLLGNGLEDAISGGAEALINAFADPLLDMVKDSVIPKLSVSLEQFKLPKQLDVPFLGGKVDLSQAIDAASFDPSGVQLSLGAGVFAPANVPTLAAPGWLTRSSGPAKFEAASAFGASLSVDYVNQALYAVWRQGLLKHRVSGPVEQFGISTGEIFADAKMPPIVVPAADGLWVHIGELELTTVFHSTTAGDAKVRLAVTLVAGAKLAIDPEGKTLTIKPSGDEANTRVVAELVGVEEGKQAASAELAGILSLFTPYIATMIANDIDLPPVAIPAIDLGIVSPAFSGRQGRFEGALKFDPTASRIGLEGKVVAY